MRRTLASLLAVAAVSLGALAPSSGAAQAPLRYVAMGDSYSAASGNVPPDLTTSPFCLRSTANFANVIASETGAQLTDVTCGGADTTHYTTSQYDGVPPQLDAVTKDIQLITMTIGGNDSGVFINSIVQCGAAGLSTAGMGSPCKDQHGSSFEDTVRNTTYPSLVQVLKATRTKAPRARIAILGYPWILPSTGGCFDKLPVAEGDVPYLRSLQATLNDAVRRAAAAAKVTYVDLNVVSEGHDACQAMGVRWVEPVLQSTNPVVVHPNALGEAEMAAQALKVLRLR